MKNKKFLLAMIVEFVVIGVIIYNIVPSTKEFSYIEILICIGLFLPLIVSLVYAFLNIYISSKGEKVLAQVMYSECIKKGSGNFTIWRLHYVYVDKYEKLRFGTYRARGEKVDIKCLYIKCRGGFKTIFREEQIPIAERDLYIESLINIEQAKDVYKNNKKITFKKILFVLTGIVSITLILCGFFL